MKLSINIKYSNPEEDVLEIGFYRGEVLLHNVFYDIDGLSEEELTNLKKEAFAKFCSVFPEVPAKDILKGFGAVDPIMYELYKQTYNPRGGGRKKGKKIGRVKPETVVYFRRVPAEWVKELDAKIEEMKGNKKMKNNWFVANDNGDVIGHDLSKERAEALAEQMQEKEPEANWEALNNED